MIIVSTIQAGKKQRLVDDWLLPPWPGHKGDGEAVTLRALISRTVLAEVEKFHERQQQRLTFQVLTESQISAGAARGKVDLGAMDPARAKRVDPEAAVATALQAFEDGLYLVLVDDVEQQELDKEVCLKSDSRVTFIRLVMLAGA